MTAKKLRIRLTQAEMVGGAGAIIECNRSITPTQKLAVELIAALEYPESAFVRYDLQDFDTLQVLMHHLYQHGFQALTREGSLRGGFDHNVYFATVVAVCSTAWLSWVTSAKAKDDARDGDDRAEYAKGHAELLDVLKQAFEIGEVMVDPILKERKERPGRGTPRPRYFGRAAYYGALENSKK